MEETLKNPLENPFFQILCRVGDMILVNLLFILCSLPVVTLGAAAAAMHKVTQDIVMENESGVFKTFFRAFRENFKQATVIWLGELVIIAAIISYRLIIAAFCVGTAASALNWLVLIVGILVLCVAVYVLPMMVRYENTTPELLRNAAILAVIKLPRTLAMAALALIMPVIFYVSVPTFINTLFFWLIIGFAFISYLDGVLMKPVFAELEKAREGDGEVGIMN